MVHKQCSWTEMKAFSPLSVLFLFERLYMPFTYCYCLPTTAFAPLFLWSATFCSYISSFLSRCGQLLITWDVKMSASFLLLCAEKYWGAGESPQCGCRDFYPPYLHLTSLWWGNTQLGSERGTQTTTPGQIWRQQPIADGITCTLLLIVQLPCMAFTAVYSAAAICFAKSTWTTSLDILSAGHPEDPDLEYDFPEFLND